MNDKNIENQLDKKDFAYSLRQRYLFVSAIIVAMIFAFAWLAQSYVSRNSDQHRHNIELRYGATQLVRKMRDDLLRVEKGLEAYLWGPSNQHREQIHQHIDKVLDSFEQLRRHEWIARNEMETAFGDLSHDVKTLRLTLNRVMDMRQEKRTRQPTVGELVTQHNIETEESDSTRYDTTYTQLKSMAEPYFSHLWKYVVRLENRINDSTKNDAVIQTDVARTVASALWLLCFVGLAVITVAYLYFQSIVLKPIATVAAALKHDAAGEPDISLPKVHNLETRHLIEAYDEMRQQVQDRQQALEHIAMHDSLTALPNRYHLLRTLQSLCEASQKNGAQFAVILLGLDRFKEINEALGQHTGDNVLRKFGQRLRYVLRESDTVARAAGDEFALILPNTDRDEALYVARKIRAEMEHPIDIEGISLSVSCSIGIALYPENSLERDELIRRAHIAMAIAKQHKTGISLYEKRFDNTSIARISLAGNLRSAIQNHQLYLCYQPQYSTHGRELSGIEVLCRWEHPERGLVSPEEFIPVAEHTGQIHALTKWVVASALEQAAEWRERKLDCGMLAINISVFNLHAPNFYRMLETQLKKWNFPPSKLMLEITETAMMADPSHVIKTLGKLRELGIKISIDDYGTGFSSLAYVKQLPVDELKIDKSFVMDMIDNENDAIIVRSTIDLAHNLGLKVVAEGVDSPEKQELLEVLDCDYMQGYHFSKPIRSHQIEYLLPPLKEKGSKVHHLKHYR